MIVLPNILLPSSTYKKNKRPEGLTYSVLIEVAVLFHQEAGVGGA